MRSSLNASYFLTAALVALLNTSHCFAADKFNLQSFSVDLSNGVDRLNALVKSARLPSKPLYPVGQEKGIELDVLRDLRSEWVENFDWEAQQAEMNK